MAWERKWWALAIFVLTVIGTALYTFTSTPVYSGVATVQLLRKGAQVLHGADVVDNSISSDTDFNTQIKLLESVAILQNVESRLTPEEVQLLIGPNADGSAQSALPALLAGRRIIPQRMTLITLIQFRHHNPQMAARIANLIASEYIAYNSRLRVEESMKAVDELKDRADQQRKRVDELANALQAFRQRGNLISLMQNKDIVTEKLKTLNMIATQTGVRLKEAEVRWKQVQLWTKENRDLTELPFIANQPSVSQLISRITPQRQLVSQMRERYKEKWPQLIQATYGLAQMEMELEKALATASNTIRSEYENALANDEAARAALGVQETTSLEVDRISVEYENLNRDYRVNEQLLEAMLIRMREASVTSSIEMENARIIDRAGQPTRPISPNVPVNLATGALGGLVVGLSLAIFLAMVNDRVKTTFDVESLIGLPLVGCIPRIPRMEPADRAQLVSNGADRPAVEAFLSLYSTLRIQESSRNARVLLVTSSLPGEGKSFVGANLALTFASQGERTLLIDGDLRKPSVQHLFRLHEIPGLVDFCQHRATLDAVIAANVHPNLDVITVGGRAKNPTQLLNSKEFENLVAEMRLRYDRIVLDTPPLGAVSDALIALPLVDGVLYTIRFDTVKRSMVQACTRRLLTANVPVCGAILNDTTGSPDGAYYGEAKKIFKDYFNVQGSVPAS